MYLRSEWEGLPKGPLLSGKPPSRLYWNKEAVDAGYRVIWCNWVPGTQMPGCMLLQSLLDGRSQRAYGSAGMQYPWKRPHPCPQWLSYILSSPVLRHCGLTDHILNLPTGPDTDILGPQLTCPCGHLLLGDSRLWALCSFKSSCPAAWPVGLLLSSLWVTPFCPDLALS